MGVPAAMQQNAVQEPGNKVDPEHQELCWHNRQTFLIR